MNDICPRRKRAIIHRTVVCLFFFQIYYIVINMYFDDSKRSIIQMVDSSCV